MSEGGLPRAWDSFMVLLGTGAACVHPARAAGRERSGREGLPWPVNTVSQVWLKGAGGGAPRGWDSVMALLNVGLFLLGLEAPFSKYG